MGMFQTVEPVKLIIRAHEPLSGRLRLYDAMQETTTELKVRRDPNCPICSRSPEEISDEEMGAFPDYEAFCAGVEAPSLHSRVVPTLKIPPVLRNSTDGEREVDGAGANVG